MRSPNNSRPHTSLSTCKKMFSDDYDDDNYLHPILVVLKWTQIFYNVFLNVNYACKKVRKA